MMKCIITGLSCTSDDILILCLGNTGSWLIWALFMASVSAIRVLLDLKIDCQLPLFLGGTWVRDSLVGTIVIQLVYNTYSTSVVCVAFATVLAALVIFNICV